MIYTFQSKLEGMRDGMFGLGMTIPTEVYEALLTSGHRRVILGVGDKKLRRALVGDGEGGGIIILGKEAAKHMGMKVNNLRRFSLETDPEPDRLDIPEEFEIVLEQDPEAKAKWDKMTLGKQRGLCYYLGSAKKEATRIKRAIEIANKMKNNALYSDLSNRKRMIEE